MATDSVVARRQHQFSHATVRDGGFRLWHVIAAPPACSSTRTLTLYFSGADIALGASTGAAVENDDCHGFRHAVRFLNIYIIF